MDYLLTSINDWRLYNKIACSTCNVSLKMCKMLIDTQKVLVFKLEDLATSTNSNLRVRSTTNINAVSSSSIKIGDSLFKLKSSAHFAVTKKAGVCYSSIVSSIGKWIHCCNETLTTACWPKEPDLHLVFYELFVPKQHNVARRPVHMLFPQVSFNSNTNKRKSVNMSHRKRTVRDCSNEW